MLPSRKVGAFFPFQFICFVQTKQTAEFKIVPCLHRLRFLVRGSPIWIQIQLYVIRFVLTSSLYTLPTLPLLLHVVSFQNPVLPIPWNTISKLAFFFPVIILSNVCVPKSSEFPCLSPFLILHCWSLSFWVLSADLYFRLILCISHLYFRYSGFEFLTVVFHLIVFWMFWYSVGSCSYLHSGQYFDSLFRVKQRMFRQMISVKCSELRFQWKPVCRWAEKDRVSLFSVYAYCSVILLHLTQLDWKNKIPTPRSFDK